MRKRRFLSSWLIRAAAPALLWPTLLRAGEDAVALPPVVVEAPAVELRDSGVVLRLPVDPLAAADLSELLATLPGVQVRSAGGIGSYSEASLRGSSGRQVRLLLDGMPLDSGGGEAASLSLVNPLLLEDVEVYQGRVPVGLGSGLAGTINLRSRDVLPEPVIGTAAIGSLGQRQLHAAAQLAETLQLSAGTQTADNDFLYRNPFKPFDPTDPERRRRERRQNAGTEQHYGLLRYRGPLVVTAHLVDDLQELPTRLNSPTTRTELGTRSYALAVALPEESSWQGALSHRVTRERYRDPASELGLEAQDSRSDTRRSLLSLGRSLGRFEDSFSAEHTEYLTEDLSGAKPDASARRLVLGNGIEWHRGENYRFNASLRTAWSRDESAGDTDSDWQIEPALGLSRTVGACVVAGNLGQRERLPTFFERYGDRGLFKGNPALQEERASYADAGARCRYPGALRHLQLTVFGQDLRDAISPTFNAQGIGRSINTEQALIAGTELAAGGDWKHWGWQLGGTWQHTEDRSDVRATRGKQLPGRFETQINTRIERPWRGLRFHYAFRFESGQYYDSPNLLKASTMQRHDVGVAGALRRLGWSLQGLNLGDDNFEQFNGFPTPGRRVVFALSWPSPLNASTDSRSTP
ncbi:TonB-dependent receptor plug domain-containing protein [Solimonas sp. K1W22B-7]|uniref:TonB-dependent receptor plug domain-containing protein n=1 Tax=Solimonas sp. K1W22B-7 TaxID=2303331 RepID=UPI0013C410ED|nr:TonB-dependent receptor plug domain-containing protein [Solimonas sp. K1W22B-7]